MTLLPQCSAPYFAEIGLLLHGVLHLCSHHLNVGRWEFENVSSWLLLPKIYEPKQDSGGDALCKHTWNEMWAHMCQLHRDRRHVICQRGPTRKLEINHKSLLVVLWQICTCNSQGKFHYEHVRIYFLSYITLNVTYYDISTVRWAKPAILPQIVTLGTSFPNQPYDWDMSSIYLPIQSLRTPSRISWYKKLDQDE